MRKRKYSSLSLESVLQLYLYLEVRYEISGNKKPKNLAYLFYFRARPLSLLNVICFAFTAGSRWGRRLHHRNAKERLAPRSDSHGPQSNTGTDQRNNRDRRESNTCLLLAYFLWSLRSFLFSLDEPASTLPKFNPVFQNTAVNRLRMCERFHGWPGSILPSFQSQVVSAEF